MNIKNLQRAAEINEILSACTDARAALSKDEPFFINDIKMPHSIAYRILQVLNVEINKLHEEVESL